MNVLVTEFDLDTLLQLVADQLRDLIDARLVAISLPQGDGLRMAAVAGDGADEYAGLELSGALEDDARARTAGAASASTPSSTTPKSSRKRRGGSARVALSMCRSSCGTRRSA